MPASLVTTVRAMPVSVFLTVTVTPGSTAPVWSLVTPVIVPVVSCADATPWSVATSSIISPSLRMRDLLSLRETDRPPARSLPLVTRRDKLGCYVAVATRP